MHRKSTVIILMLLAVPLLMGDPGVLKKVEDLHKNDSHKDIIVLLENYLEEEDTGNSSQFPDIYWLLARAYVFSGQQMLREGASKEDLLLHFEQGQSYGRQSIAIAGQKPESYFWTSSNLGMWGQTKGVLDSLAKAKEMRSLLFEAIEIEADFSDAYYILGQLYSAVPGLISFGDMDKAVNLARQSVALDPQNMSYKVQLANHLTLRDWSAKERVKKSKKTKKPVSLVAVDKAFHFENRLNNIGNYSDYEEAQQILRSLLDEYKTVQIVTQIQKEDYELAQALYKP